VSKIFSHRGAVLAVLSGAVATSSCGGGGSGGAGNANPPAAAPPPVVVPRAVAQSDLEIAQTLYAGTPRTPEGFYAEATVPAQDPVAISHLKNGDVQAIDSSQPLYELCTDDWNQALEWSELKAQNAPQYADLVETNEATRFYEFGRVRAGEPQVNVRQRVFKCSYVDRATANLNADEGAAGQLNLRPLTAAELRTFSEYLWSFTPYNNYGHAVLKSEAGNAGAALTHTLYIASLAAHGASSTCDRVDILAWRHRLDSSNGELTLEVDTEFSFGARENSGVAELCGA
jgi:hypothetical protein